MATCPNCGHEVQLSSSDRDPGELYLASIRASGATPDAHDLTNAKRLSRGKKALSREQAYPISYAAHGGEFRLIRSYPNGRRGYRREDGVFVEVA
jgi:hypothetical protein